MGIVIHHAFVVTASYRQEADEGNGGHWADVAHAEATRLLGDLVTPVIDGGLNNVRSFAVLPDGSKEGWAESDEVEAGRARLGDWLRGQAYEDGSSPLSWVLVEWGPDTDRPSVVRSSERG